MVIKVLIGVRLKSLINLKRQKATRKFSWGQHYSWTFRKNLPKFALKTFLTCFQAIIFLFFYSQITSTSNLSLVDKDMKHAIIASWLASWNCARSHFPRNLRSSYQYSRSTILSYSLMLFSFWNQCYVLFLLKMIFFNCGNHFHLSFHGHTSTTFDISWHLRSNHF